MKILIENLTFDTIIGILEHERTTAQKVHIDCIIDYPYSEGHFINYAEVAEMIETTMHKERFELIETALEVLNATLKEHFPLIKELLLTIRKPTILPNCSVGVQHATHY
ncbi:dihydroneopterin aldolase [Sulfuricurvum sp.]|uniref:dihydroneopterin aldolase n=1 Tax=Sulfuricurvum sp. TaxID=2025608 RepID=UPI0026281FBF|nr:dihydroneopterin aldolase [Sulfuricurvum sp.]MDD2265402.1 dihydroneopterin aldolase [Sulfuricurvum sp.]MDD2784935.1 dihydroneopterin aldolase [Sulfuricurvum sp.]